MRTSEELQRPEGCWCLRRPYAEKYATDEKAFFEDYAKAHAKLSELGVQWDPEPLTISPI
jgi:hypothetical protein